MSKEKQSLEESKEDYEENDDLRSSLKSYYLNKKNLPKFIDDEDIPELTIEECY